MCAAALLACALPLHAAEVREQYFSVGADVDTHCHVTATQIDKNVPAPLAAVLARSVRQWQFVPAKRDGQPVPAHSFVSTKLRAVPASSGQYHLRISFEGNGPRLDRTSMQPQYPRDAIHAGQSAFAILDATVQSDGQLSEMTVSSKFEG